MPRVDDVTPLSDVVDSYHGIVVVDRYRWLEDGDSAAVRGWTDQQNAQTRAFIDEIPGLNRLRNRFAELLQIGAQTAPVVRILSNGRARYFHFRREGTQDHGILYVREEEGTERPLIDVAKIGGDHSIAIAWTSVSPDGALVAWGRSEDGSEESTLHIRDVATGEDLSEVIPNTRFASIAWQPNCGGFFYTRYPEPGTVPKGDERYHRSVFLHVLGTDPNSDTLVFPDQSTGLGVRAKTDSPSVFLSPNGRWLTVRVHQGAQRSEVYLLDLSDGPTKSWIPIARGIDALFRPIPRDNALYILTNDGAPRSRLLAVDYDHPECAAWCEVIPEKAHALRSVAILGDVIVASYLDEAATRLERFALDGRSLGPLELPTIGTATVHGPHDGAEAFVRFTSFLTPSLVIRFNLKTGEGTTWAQTRIAHSIADVIVTRKYATSMDGTSIPMFVVERAGTKRDGTNPTILCGYGGFNRNASPTFNVSALAAVERGAVWVQAVLRGGGEFGDTWHRAGMLSNKQNTFDDFIACAEALFDAKVTSPSKLAVAGSSNGGLLTAAVATQRPDLFRAVLSDVPLTDMLRYHHFRIAKLWVSEYGSSEDPDQFRALYAYSPYHRVEDGTIYPSMLFVTAENDSRVDPMHARKMTARMQEAQSESAEGRPILIRLEANAGHGAGKPISKLADELSDEMAFLFNALGCILLPIDCEYSAPAA
jgi:prolyl oligopeptidase